MMPGGHPPPTSIHIPPAYQQQSNGRKRNYNIKIMEARDVAPTITEVEEEAAATEEISGMPEIPKSHIPTP